MELADVGGYGGDLDVKASLEAGARRLVGREVAPSDGVRTLIVTQTLVWQHLSGCNR